MTAPQWAPQEVVDERERALRLLGNAASPLRSANESLRNLARHGRAILSSEELDEIVHAIHATALLVNWEGRERRRAESLAAAERLQKAEAQAREAEECYRASRKAVDDATP